MHSADFLLDVLQDFTETYAQDSHLLTYEARRCKGRLLAEERIEVDPCIGHRRNVDGADESFWLPIPIDVVVRPELEQLELVPKTWDEVVEAFLNVLVLIVLGLRL